MKAPAITKTPTTPAAILPLVFEFSGEASFGLDEAEADGVGDGKVEFSEEVEFEEEKGGT